MALKADSQGFLIGGEPVNLKPEKDKLNQIASDVAAIKKAVIGSVGLKNADLKNATTSTANATAKATQKAVTNAIKTAIPRQRDSNGKFVAKTMVTQVVDKKIVTPKNNAATNIATRDSADRFTSGNSKADTAGSDAKFTIGIANAVSKSVGAIKGLGEGTGEIDPTVKAFQEVAEPLGRGFEFLKGGSRDDKQTGWLKKIFSSINVFRKEEFKSNKDQKTLLQDIDNKTGTGSGSGLLGGLIAGLGGLLTKIPLIGSGLGGIGKVLGGIGGGSGGMLGGLGGLGKGMIGGAKGLLKKVPFVGALMSGLGAMTDIFSNESDTELTREEKDRKNGSAVGGAAGSVGGMMAGAAIGSMLGPIGTVVGGAVGMFLGDQGGQIIGDVVGGWVNQLRDADIAGTIIKAWESTTSMIKSGWDSLTSTIEKGWKSISDVGEKVVETAADAANATNDFITETTGVDVKQTVTDAGTSLSNMASSAYDFAKKGVTKAGESLSNTASAAYDYAKQGATKAVETAKSGTEWVGNNTTVGKGIKSAGNWVLGQTSKMFESGKGGAGTVSTGKGDHGGASYGTYQLSSKAGTLQNFLKKSPYGSQFEGLTPGTSEFDQKWKEIATNDPEFGNAQHEFIKQSHFDPAMAKLAKSGIDLSSRGKAVQDSLWSTSVQFGAGGGADLFKKALAGKDTASMSDADMVSAIQDYKIANNDAMFKSSSSDIRAGTAKRALQEKDRLLALASQPESPAIASIMNPPTQPIAAPNIQSVAPVQPIKTPQIPEIAPVTIPLNSMASNNPPPAPVINLDVGQDLSDRNLAHLVTGGLGGRWG